MTEDSLNEFISLLWPSKEVFRNSEQVISDNCDMISNLELQELANALSPDTHHTISVKDLLTNLSEDTNVIKYRLDVIEDLLNNPQIVSCFKNILPLMDELLIISTHRSFHEIILQETASRVGELDTYISCITQLKKVFEETNKNLKSTGLNKLYEKIKNVSNDVVFKSMEKELPELQKGLRKISSVTLGINFNAKLHPFEFTIVSINEEPYKENTLMNRLFGKKSTSKQTGISPFVEIKEIETIKNNRIASIPNPFQLAIFKELDNITQSATKPIAKSIAKYVKVNSRLLIDLRTEIIFLLGLEKLIYKMKSMELNMCKPEVLSKEKRQYKINEMYNINLAINMSYVETDKKLNDKIVCNNFDFDKNSRIFILTGPNQGGKTTYTQAIGLVQILFQLGSYVPCKKAAISPVDKIFTHFPVEEKPESQLGRLGEESKRLKEIFNEATQYSLILLNESLQSTSPYEGLYISKEVIMGLKLLGARTIFATHFHELALNLEKLNSSIPEGSKVVSLISSVIENKELKNSEQAKRTYKIVQGIPQGKSYAKDIASKYGLSFENIVKTVKDKN
ncbi:hypothetical protein RBH29_00610 [Herbivorax sp. ANBcel31]|uniref:MutS-related protein n=1 Tax=Herbivorax sp. ANBcel31 TaxID=3069754 RepID=UPI0027B31939|nr:hypothetical protein [Herbivorax sp. ANBcel31]MDQ2084938.1 hypothetical protein [Herbivorax sp. ANBcel31]